MEFLFKNTLPFTAVLLTGLSAGLFYAWEFSVIPGTKLVSDKVYLHTMQAINRAILNPGFFIVFWGALFLLLATCFIEYAHSRTSFIIMVLATLSYMIGTIGVTAAGNVPMNNALDAVNLGGLSEQALREFRETYEPKWNKLHSIRTFFSVVAFALSLLSVFTHFKK